MLIDSFEISNMLISFSKTKISIFILIENSLNGSFNYRLYLRKSNIIL